MQKDLSVIITITKLESSCRTLVQKSNSRLVLSKKTSSNTSVSIKLDAYCGYVMPILYAIEVVFLNSADTKLELVQRNSPLWISGSPNYNYKERFEFY